MENKIYLDNAASTKPYEEVIFRMSEVARFSYGNSSSTHKLGVKSQKIVKNASETLANILHCEPNELIFTSGGSEANNMAIKGIFDANKGSGKHVITTPYEHPTLINSVINLKKEGGSYDLLPFNDEKILDIDKLHDLINDQTILVSIMQVNSETGAIIDLKNASSITKDKKDNIVFHTDATQGFGKLPINLSQLNNIDLLSLSGHKIKGPKGVGLLYVKKNTNIKCLIKGGSHQYGLRAGTLNTPGIAGLEVAAKLAYKKLNENYDYVSELNEYTREMLKEYIDDYIINSTHPSSPYILNIAFSDIKSEVLLNHLSFKDIFISAGSACSSSKKQSHVLKSMGVNNKYINGAIRISFSFENTKEEIDTFIKEVKDVLPMLRTFRRK